MHTNRNGWACVFLLVLCGSGAAGLLGCRTLPNRQGAPSETADYALPACPPAAVETPVPPGYEARPVFEAATLIHERYQMGQHHRVRETVWSDGLRHHFCIDSDFGTFHAVGAAAAEERVREVFAIAALQELSNMAAAGEGVREGAASVVTAPFRGVAAVIRNPLHLIAIIPAPVALVVGAARSTQQLIELGFTEEYAKTIVGYYRARGDLAARFGVSARSDNPVLNESLDAVAWEFYAGRLPLSVVERMLPIPGIPRVEAFEGARGSAAPVADAVADRVWARDARTRMRRLGATREVRREFEAHPAFDGRARHAVVEALWTMEEVEGRVAIIPEMAAVATRDEAYAVRRAFEMLAGYHETVAPLALIERALPFPVARRADGGRVIAVYSDHAAWIPESAHRFRELARCLAAEDAAPLTEVWIAGPASTETQLQLAAMGWTPYPETLGLLVPWEAEERRAWWEFAR